MKKILFVLKEIGLYLWQLPQNILGLIFLLCLRGKKCELYNITFYYVRNFRGGISLGRYIFINNIDKDIIRHEYGHCKQSQLLGWLYLLVIGLPSIIHAGLHDCEKEGKIYYHFWTERWADELMNIRRGNESN